MMKEQIKKMREENGGFTLAELLIVVAIIAVLVAIAIPVFTSALENSREATDAANIRSAYAEVAAKALTDSSTAVTATVEKQQTQSGWQNTALENIAGIAVTDLNSTESTTIQYTPSTDSAVTITIDGQPATSSFVQD